MNAAARLIFYTRRSEHVTSLLHDLHWLPVPERIQFRLSVLTFRCLHGSAPSYLANSLRCIVDVAGRQRLRSSDVTTPVIPSTLRSAFRDRLLSGRSKDLEPFACISRGRDVLIDVSSRTEVIPLPL